MTKSILPKFVLAATLCGFLLSCNKNDKSNMTQQASTKPGKVSLISAEYSDEDVFRGVIFADGLVAEKLEDFKEFNIHNLTDDAEKIQKITEFQSNIINQIKATNPEYLHTFRTQMESGDVATVRAALNDVSDVIFKSASALAGVSVDQIKAQCGVVANNFSTKYGLDQSQSKDEMVNAVRAELSEPMPSIVIFFPPLLYFLPFNYVAVTQNTVVFNTYETDRFVSVIALNLAAK